MLTKSLVAIALVAGAFSAQAADDTINPLNPRYQGYTASLSFAPAEAVADETVKSPLQPNFYDRDVMTTVNATVPDVDENNPLHPSYKRS